MIAKYKNVLISVGQVKSASVRMKLFNICKNLNAVLPVIISPTAYVSKHTKIGEGTIVMNQALVNADVKIGKNCIINTKALIEHDCTIEDNCHISTASVLNGGCIVKENTFFGSNATSKEYRECDGFIKAGSLVK